jgi:hypothetical protein
MDVCCECCVLSGRGLCDEIVVCDLETSWMRRPWPTLGAVAPKTNKHYILWVCICGLRCPARTAHTPYYIVICGLPGCTIFFHVIS